MEKLLMITIISCGIPIFAANFAALEEPLSFAEARELILSRNAGLKSAQTETDAARAGVVRAGAFPNPGIIAALDKFGANEIEICVEQTIELGNKRKLRTEAQQKEVDVSVCAAELNRLELEAEIVRRFVPIATTEGKLAVVDSIIGIIGITREQIQRRVDAGVSRITDLIRIEIDSEQLQLERNALLRENEQARRKFAALGSAQDVVLMNVFGELNNESEFPDSAFFQKAVEGHPVLAAYIIEHERLDTERRQLRANALPDLNLSAGYLRSNAENSSSPIVGLSMSIPLFNRSAAAQKQTELRQKALGERRENSLRLHMADVHEILGRLKVIDYRLKALKSGTVPKVQQVYGMLQEYYNAGNTGFLDLTQAQEELLRLKLEILDIEHARALELADLMQITSINIQIVK